MEKEYVLFDLDGTITDPKIGITKSVQYALRHFGINVENLDMLEPFIGPPLMDSFQQFYGLSQIQAEEAIQKYREYFKDQGIYENYVYDGMEALLKRQVARGRKLYVATSKPTVFAERILVHFNIYTYFQAVVGSELDGRRSHKTEVIQHVLTEAGIEEKNKVVMIGDRCFDMIGAKDLGIDGIGVLYGYGSEEELCSSGATYIAQSVQQLYEILERV